MDRARMRRIALAIAEAADVDRRSREARIVRARLEGSVAACPACGRETETDECCEECMAAAARRLLEA